MSIALDYKCPNCGGAVKFDAASGQLKCESCDSFFTREQFEAQADAVNAAKETSSYNWQQSGNNESFEGMNSYSCKSCGAEIVADDTTAASTCPYCGSPVVLSGRLSGMCKPDCVLPFKIDKANAEKRLRDFYKGKFLLPSIFKNQNKIKEVKGVYVPFWLFDCAANANICFDATKTRHWSDTNYNYTETSHYNVYRAGSIGFSSIPVDGSSKMDDAYMESIEPFDYKDMTAFDPAYLSGFLADKYDVDAQASIPRAENRIENSTCSAFASTVNGYDTVMPTNTSIKTSQGSYKYALLPVWMLTTKWHNKLYTFAVNGQTGKVTGELPIDKKKSMLVFGAVAAVVLAVSQFLIF